jgi:hypothetical protein
MSRGRYVSAQDRSAHTSNIQLATRTSVQISKITNEINRTAGIPPIRLQYQENLAADSITKTSPTNTLICIRIFGHNEHVLEYPD